jgi:hypothetical protein
MKCTTVSKVPVCQAVFPTQRKTALFKKLEGVFDEKIDQ